MPAASVAALLYLVPIGHAFAVTPALESEVKATFLYKFTSFVDWPADAFGSPQDPLTICIIGDDEVARVIDRAAAGQRSGGHPILVRHLDRIQRQSRCQVLYAAPSQRQTMTQALEAVRGRPVLTITDQAGSPAVMGMITFVVEDNRVRFDIDDQAAATAGLTISSRLLILARTVIPRS